MKLIPRCLLLFITLVGISRADTIKEVSQYLKQNSVLPITGSFDHQLAENLLIAQSDPACFYCGPESLLLSEQAVDKAIWIYATEGYDGFFPTVISAQDAGPNALVPIVWFQSVLAINPNATISITPSSIDFGDVPVGQSVSTEPVTTPEPGVWLLCLAALGPLFWLRKCKPAH